MLDDDLYQNRVALRLYIQQAKYYIICYSKCKYAEKEQFRAAYVDFCLLTNCRSSIVYPSTLSTQSAEYANVNEL